MHGITILEVIAGVVIGLPLWIAIAEGDESMEEVKARAERKAQEDAEDARMIAAAQEIVRTHTPEQILAALPGKVQS